MNERYIEEAKIMPFSQFYDPNIFFHVPQPHSSHVQSEEHKMRIIFWSLPHDSLMRYCTIFIHVYSGPLTATTVAVSRNICKIDREAKFSSSLVSCTKKGDSAEKKGQLASNL